MVKETQAQKTSRVLELIDRESTLITACYEDIMNRYVSGEIKKEKVIEFIDLMIKAFRKFEEMMTDLQVGDPSITLKSKPHLRMAIAGLIFQKSIIQDINYTEYKMMVNDN